MDGVLNSKRSRARESDLDAEGKTAGIEDHMLDNLVQIVKRSVATTGVPLHIVISSTWRQEPDKFKELEQALNARNLNIFGQTPDLTDRGDRVDEIKSWLEETVKEKTISVVKWIVIDDLDLRKMNPTLSPDHFVHTTDDEGLTTEHIAEGVLKLTGVHDDRGPDVSIVFLNDSILQSHSDLGIVGPHLVTVVEHLVTILDQTGAHIVGSSNWRADPGTKHEFVQALNDRGIQLWDYAPHLEDGDHVDEIRAWLCENFSTRQGLVVKYLVIDNLDLVSMNPRGLLHDHFLRVSDEGLREENIEEAVRKLSGETASWPLCGDAKVHVTCDEGAES